MLIRTLIILLCVVCFVECAFLDNVKEREPSYANRRPPSQPVNVADYKDLHKIYRAKREVEIIPVEVIEVKPIEPSDEASFTDRSDYESIYDRHEYPAAQRYYIPVQKKTEDKEPLYDTMKTLHRPVSEPVPSKTKEGYLFSNRDSSIMISPLQCKCTFPTKSRTDSHRVDYSITSPPLFLHQKNHQQQRFPDKVHNSPARVSSDDDYKFFVPLFNYEDNRPYFKHDNNENSYKTPSHDRNLNKPSSLNSCCEKNYHERLPSSFLSYTKGNHFSKSTIPSYERDYIAFKKICNFLVNILVKPSTAVGEDSTVTDYSPSSPEAQIDIRLG